MSKQTKSSRPVVRPANIQDIRKFYKVKMPCMRAWVAELDGEAIGMGGLIRYFGRWYVFLDLKDECRPYKVMLVRWGKIVMNEVRQQGLKTVYSIIDPTEPTAKRWHASLGFERTAVGYRWQEK